MSRLRSALALTDDVTITRQRGSYVAGVDHPSAIDRYFEAETLGHLGEPYAATGDRDPARTAWEAAAAILDDLGHSEAADMYARIEQLGYRDTRENHGPAEVQ